MIRRKLRLHPLARKRILRRHNTRVVNDYIDSGDIAPRVNLRSCSPDAGQGGQIDFEKPGLHAWMRGFDFVGCSLDFGPVAAGED